MRQVRNIIGEIPENERTYDRIKRAIESMKSKHKEVALLRLKIAEKFLSIDDRSLALPEAGHMLILDMRSPMLTKSDAMALLIIIARLMSQQVPGLKLFVIDEAHNFQQTGMSEHFLKLVKLMRHNGTTTILATQLPKDIHKDILSLYKVIILHRLNSPSDIQTLHRSVSGLKIINDNELAILEPSQAYIWTEESNLPRYKNTPFKVTIRPRVTKHGGATKRQIPDS